MRPDRPSLRFFLDESIPDSVGRILREAGYEAVFLHDSGLARGSADPLVCAYAEVSESILVAIDGDMKQIAKLHGIGNGSFKNLNLLKISCPEPDAARRLKSALSLIEHEWGVGTGKLRRLFVEIASNVIRTVR